MLEKLRGIEDAYMELLCEKESTGSTDIYSNSFVHEIYAWNFTLVKKLTSEEDIKFYVTKHLSDMKKNGMTFFKTVFHPNIKLSQEFLAWAAMTGFEISKINYMIAPKEFDIHLKNDPACVIKQAETAEEIQMGVECAMKFDEPRMGFELARKKWEKKRTLYLNKSMVFYICYVDECPIGHCDRFEKDSVVKFEEFTVLNEYQGMGYGSKMLKKMIDDENKQCNRSVYVVTDAEGEDHNIYYKFGFDLVGEETELFFMEIK